MVVRVLGVLPEKQLGMPEGRRAPRNGGCQGRGRMGESSS